MPKKEATNLNKLYWPKEGYTKGDLLHYYEKVASYILPHLKNRPVMLKRFPEGIEGGSFYQKDISPLHAPKKIQTISLMQEKPMEYLLIQDKFSLLYAANLGTIEIHPFLAQIKDLYQPSFLVIDLDPEDIPFEKVIEIAQTVHETLESVKFPCYCKTTGGRGLHIYVPMHEKYLFEQTKRFGELIAALVHQKLPKITSLERKPVKRQKRVYLDVYQNNYAMTVVAPYSLRGRPYAPVSTPLEWSEVKTGLNPLDFTLKTVIPRVEKLGDLFKPVLGKGVNLEAGLKRLEKLLPAKII